MGVWPSSFSRIPRSGRVLTSARRQTKRSSAMQSFSCLKFLSRAAFARMSPSSRIQTRAGIRPWPRRFTASKTGFNDKAGYCLAATVKLRGRGTFAVVLLGSESKYWRVRDLRRVLIWLEQGRQQRRAL